MLRAAAACIAEDGSAISRVYLLYTMREIFLHPAASDTTSTERTYGASHLLECSRDVIAHPFLRLDGFIP